MRNLLTQVALLLALLLAVAAVQAESTLITNVDVFDGTSSRLSQGVSVLVTDNKIEAVGRDVAAPENANTVDGGGRVLMPGMIDAHTHLSIISGVRELQA